MITNPYSSANHQAALPNVQSRSVQAHANATTHADNDPATLEQTAIQFESLFIHELLKTMRASISQSELLGSDAMQQYTEMYDQQLSTQLAEQGIGLRALIMQQLGADASATKARWPTKQAFINEVSNIVEQAVQTHSQAYDPKALLAIAALETGWGQHVIANAQGESSHNLFNIKATARWQGETVTTQTKEYIEHNVVSQQADFRRYATLTAAVDDFIALMQQPRYAKATALAHKGEAFLQAVADAGYATDPQYASKLTRIYKTL